MAISYEVKLALDNFTDTVTVNGSPHIANVFDAAYNGQMSTFLLNIIQLNSGEMDGAFLALNSITNQMKSLFGLSSSKSAPHKEIDASDIDVAAGQAHATI